MAKTAPPHTAMMFCRLRMGFVHWFGVREYALVGCGFGVWVSGFGVRDAGFGFQGSGLWFRVRRPKAAMKGFRVWCLWPWEGLEFRV